MVSYSSEYPYYAGLKPSEKVRQSHSLQFLAWWMEVGRDSVFRDSLERSKDKREERWKRTAVTVVEHKSTTPFPTEFKDIENLKGALQVMPATTFHPLPSDGPSVKVLIVEDLSRNVIEFLGSRFKVNPSFFVAYIGNRGSYAVSGNKGCISVPSVTPQQWFQIQNVRLRYHQSRESFQDACANAMAFNVYRMPSHGISKTQSSKECFSVTNTLTSIWMGKDREHPCGTIGIVLVDPTVNEGILISIDQGTYFQTPDLDSISSSLNDQPSSWCEDIVQMTYRHLGSKPLATLDALSVHAAICPSAFAICAEWLSVCDFIRVAIAEVERLNGVSSRPNSIKDYIDTAFDLLSAWQNGIPKWRDMVIETVEQALLVDARTPTIFSKSTKEVFEKVLPDFKRILNRLDDLQTRIDRLFERRTAQMQLTAARESLEESRNLARQSWLATIFVPLTLMCGLFSMSDDIGSMKDTFKTCFAAAVPVTIIAVIIARWGSYLSRYLKTAIGEILSLSASIKSFVEHVAGRRSPERDQSILLHGAQQESHEQSSGWGTHSIAALAMREALQSSIQWCRDSCIRTEPSRWQYIILC
jgi:hypothetical protein